MTYAVIRSMKRRIEDDIQRTVIQHLRERGAPGVVYFHVPNGGKRPPKEAAIMKGLGVRAGVSDLIILHKSRMFALELKAPNAKPPTESQMQFISDLNAAGGFGCIVVGLDKAIKVLETWGLLRGVASLRSVA